MNGIESLAPTAATLGGGFFVVILIGYALKKVIKIVAVIVGLFLAGLAYLQYNQIANINWNKLQQISEGTITTISNLTMQIPGISSGSDGDVQSELRREIYKGLEIDADVLKKIGLAETQREIEKRVLLLADKIKLSDEMRSRMDTDHDKEDVKTMIEEVLNEIQKGSHIKPDK